MKGLDSFPQDQWPDNIPLLYYSYHIMVGLGTIFIAIMVVSALLLWRGKLYRALDALDPDAESAISLHRQHRRLDDGGTRPPALAGLRPHAHADGYSKMSRPATECLLCSDFMGMYTVLGILFLFLVRREIEHGPVGGPGVPLKGERWQHSGS